MGADGDGCLLGDGMFWKHTEVGVTRTVNVLNATEVCTLKRSRFQLFINNKEKQQQKNAALEASDHRWGESRVQSKPQLPHVRPLFTHLCALPPGVPTVPPTPCPPLVTEL